MTWPIQIMLVDDHPLVRQGCRQALEAARFEVVAEASDGEQACALFAKVLPQAVVMDLSMGTAGGLEAIHRMRAAVRGARILVLSVHDEPSIATRALRAGALGYVTKASAPDTLVTAVGRVAQGRPFLSPDIATALVLAELDDAVDPLKTLSAREFDVFRLLVDGASHDDIANALSLSHKTISNCYLRIKSKLRRRTTADLVKLGLQCGVTKRNVLAQ